MELHDPVTDFEEAKKALIEYDEWEAYKAAVTMVNDLKERKHIRYELDRRYNDYIRWVMEAL